MSLPRLRVTGGPISRRSVPLPLSRWHGWRRAQCVRYQNRVIDCGQAQWLCSDHRQFLPHSFKRRGGGLAHSPWEARAVCNVPTPAHGVELNLVVGLMSKWCGR